jgi:hypothetical protein
MPHTRSSSTPKKDRLAASSPGRWLVGHHRILGSTAECMKKKEKNR